jgi:hypothetical protein
MWFVGMNLDMWFVGMNLDMLCTFRFYVEVDCRSKFNDFACWCATFACTLYFSNLFFFAK